MKTLIQVLLIEAKCNAILNDQIFCWLKDSHKWRWMKGLKLVTCKELKSTNKEIMLIFHLCVVIKQKRYCAVSVFLPVQLIILF